MKSPELAIAAVVVGVIAIMFLPVWAFPLLVAWVGVLTAQEGRIAGRIGARRVEDNLSHPPNAEQEIE